MKEETIIEKKHIETITNFKQDFYLIEKCLRSLLNDNFIVITTREGSRGVDFKGASVSHVIICLNKITSSLFI
jgi:hypothetical protein